MLPMTGGAGIVALGLPGLVFASWAEAVFVLLMLIPLAFFGGCALYLWRLLLKAVPVGARVANLTPLTAQGESADAATQMPTGGGKRARFALLIPAHNEELLLGAALESLFRLDYPRDAYRIIVIADNCTDRTAQIAREAGAIALERFNTVQIGKGYALEWALENLLGSGDNRDALREIADFDGVVILDADTQVSRNMLTAFEAGLKRGDKAMQVRYDVLNAEESWRTRLMTCALALAHVVKPLGREQMGLSDGLKGNGMCFAREVVTHVPWSGESITEDIEYTLRLCRAGYRVAFLPEAAVWAQMPTTGDQAVTQRKRWEGGRYRLLFTVAPRLLAEGVKSRSRILRDRAMELIIPPFAEMFAVPFALLVMSALCALAFHWRWAWGMAWGWAIVLLLQAGYLGLGMRVARVKAATALSLLYAPFYIVWKLGLYALMAAGGSDSGWKRTDRRKLQQ